MLENVALIIPAAGEGLRFNADGGIRKPYVLLAGEPILLHTLRRFAGIPAIVQRVLAVHPEDVEAVRKEWGRRLEELGVSDVVAGGKTRQQSVACALAVLQNDIGIVAVHDSVRPFVSRRAIEESIQRAAEFGGAVVASGMIATVKRADTERRIVETVPRENLWLAQTPQTFRKGILAEAYEAAARDGVAATDDSFLVERVGGTVVIVEESAANIKITTLDDLRLAEAIAREIDRQP